MAFADPVMQMTEAIHDCLNTKAAENRTSEPRQNDGLLFCVTLMDFECRASTEGQGTDRYSCWNTQLEAWTAVRETLFDKLVFRASQIKPESGENNENLVDSLIQADQSWKEDRYADCEYRTLMWRGVQRTVESYTCPVEIEALRAIMYFDWAQMDD